MFWEFDYVGNFKFKEGFAWVEKDGKWGYINTKGCFVIFDESKK